MASEKAKNSPGAEFGSIFSTRSTEETHLHYSRVAVRLPNSETRSSPPQLLEGYRALSKEEDARKSSRLRLKWARNNQITFM
ncbi:hypothetical protein AGABI1DRAFT_133664 [Agaricus bisporus var. burnettii JB137-S8]|uniref:Uncharacterized protein n=1 Tax=Agaricus bisporus var. burnettii (strain JB137-S8 / ATCC MYA-4627 / FGSC 10392) TaxID=597362 RepID=K5WFS2_AGABU|nr:uncharacterized protein AGABI1DRAFT_133664 [Agaricus bisporus var. burnettii JB137-S8]EKM74076.1 hypothetical protein AGABI1DRAFT_133664 [Agaricus bisporus var. burnettii JB137-S8]